VARGSELIQNYSDGRRNRESKYFTADVSARIPECEQALKQAEHELAVHMKEDSRFDSAIQEVTYNMSQLQETQKMMTQRTRQLGGEIEQLTQAQDNLKLDDGLEAKIRGMDNDA
jgi:uncharacterized protein YhaN